VRLRLEPRPPLPGRLLLLFPLAAVLGAFALGAVFLVLAGGDVPQCYRLIFQGSLGTRFDFFETLLKMTPLCWTGLAAAVAFRAGFWNIGAEGQLAAGAAAAAWLGTLSFPGSPLLLLPLALLGAAAVGGLLAALAAWLKVRFRADEVVSTLMLNYVVIYLVAALLDTLWRDPVSGWPHSPPLPEAARLGRLFPPLRLHSGFLLVLAAALACHVLFRFTRPGLRVRAVGLNPRASAWAGIAVGKTVLFAAFLSGSLAALGGAGEVCGVQFYLVDSIAAGAGYYGVAIALLAGLHPLGVIPAAFLFAVVITGSGSLSQFTGVPVYFADILQGLILMNVLVAFLFARYRPVRVREGGGR